MTTRHRFIGLMMIVVPVTAVMTYYATVYLGEVSSASDSSASTGPGEPLYWVAPMDANYRRDKPGKSPMGMDLKASIEFINS